MRARSFWFSCLCACLTLTAVAQEGHPLIGTWSGEWGPSATDRKQILVIMEWNTTTLSGVINPGEADEAPIRVGALDSTKWTVHLEADSKDEKGNPVKVTVDGKLPAQVADSFWEIQGDAPARRRMTGRIAQLSAERLWTWEERFAAELESVEALRHAA